MPDTLLEVDDLHIHFPTDDGLVKAVDGLSFSLERGRTLGIVGESGSGKSVTSLGIMGLHHGSNAQITGHIKLDGEELVGATANRIRELRGSKMAMIFQDPLSSLHPFYTVGVADRRGVPGAQPGGQEGGAQARGRHAGPGGHPAARHPGR